MVANKRKASKSAIRPTLGDRVFDTVNYILMSIFFLIMFYPLYYIVIASISDITQVGLGNVVLWPIGINFDAYIQVLNHDMIWTGYGNSIIYTVLNVVYNIVIMLPLAYALSKKYLFGRNTITWFFLFTMYFSGGLIPAYLLRTQYLGLNNTIWVMILGSVSVYYVVVTRTFFTTSIPDELYEAAEIDGAGRFKRIYHITLPCIMPVISVILIMNIGWIINIGFEKQYLLGSDLVRSYSEVLDVYVLKYGIGQSRYSFGTAIGIFKSVVSIALVFIANAFAKRAGQESIL